MRVLFDYKGFLRPFGGIYEYARQLIGELREIGVEPVIHGPVDKLPGEWRNEVETVPLYMFKGWRKLGTDRIQTEWAFRKSRADVFHSLGYTVPMTRRIPIVLTVYDFIHERFPEQFVGGNQESFAKFKRSKIERADLLLPISRSTQEDCITYVPDFKGASRVIHLGVDPEFFLRDEKRIREVKQKYGLERPYLFYSGPRHGYKNFTVLYQAYRKGNLNRHMDLVSVGCQETLSLKDLELWAEEGAVSAGVKLLGFLPADDRLALIQGASAVVVPTEYEGFGFPVLEGMASGVPVVCGKVASIPEVAGNEAIYVDVKDPDSVLAGLQRIHASDVASLVERARKRAGSFTWRKCAEETMAAYAEAMALKQK